MSARTENNRLYVEALLNRLRRLYVERAKIPGQPKTMTFDQLQRLCMYVTTEGYAQKDSE